MVSPILELTNINKSFGHVHANKNINLKIKETSRKMFLSGECDATSTLLDNENLIENKFNQLPYIKFKTNLL